MLAGAFKGCSTVICRGWNPVPNSWWLQQGEISTVTLMRAQICMAHRANQRASSLLMCWGSNNLLPLLLRLEDFQSLYKGQCNWRRGGGTDRHRWGGGKEEDLGNLLQLSVNFCRVYIRLKSKDRCWGWCFATALHVGNQASSPSSSPPLHPPYASAPGSSFSKLKYVWIQHVSEMYSAYLWSQRETGFLEYF